MVDSQSNNVQVIVRCSDDACSWRAKFSQSNNVQAASLEVFPRAMLQHCILHEMLKLQPNRPSVEGERVALLICKFSLTD